MVKCIINLTQNILDQVIFNNYRIILFHLVGESDELLFTRFVAPLKLGKKFYWSSIIGEYKSKNSFLEEYLKNLISERNGTINIVQKGKQFYEKPYTLFNKNCENYPSISIIENFKWIENFKFPEIENKQDEDHIIKIKNLKIPVFSFSSEITEENDGVRKYLKCTRDILKLEYMTYKKGTFSF